MRFFSFRRSAMRLVSFASMGIARGLHRSSRTHAAHCRRREQFAAWRFGSESLEGRKMLALTNTVPAPQTAFIDTYQFGNYSVSQPIAFTAAQANGISVSHTTIGTNPLRVSLSVDAGLLTLVHPNPNGGIVYRTGDGYQDPTLVFEGTLADVNTALSWVGYTPPAEQYFQWTTAAGGNGHWYQFVSGNKTWTQARDEATTAGGYLATVTSAAESTFVNGLVYDPAVTFWLGGYQDRTSVTYREPAGGWRWVTNEAWSYTNWNAGDPNNGGGNEDHLAGNWSSSGKWADLQATDARPGYIVEFDVDPRPAPRTRATLTLTTDDLGFAGPRLTDTDTVAINLARQPGFAGSPNYSTNPAAFDTTFGTNGVVTVDPSLGGIDRIIDMRVMPGGKIVAVGALNNRVGLLRFNADGTLDTTFGPNGDGGVQVDLGNGVLPIEMQIDLSGRIVVLAPRSILRFTADGAVDTTFGTAGNAAIVANNNWPGTGLRVTPENTYAVAVGDLFTAGRFQLYGETGVKLQDHWDSSFVDGMEKGAFASGDGSVTVIGGQNSTLVSVVYRPFNTGFQRVGQSSADLTFNFEIRSSLTLADGRILIVGSSNTDFFVARLLRDGRLDTSFGTNGVSRVNVLNAADEGWRATVTADGKILVTGYGSNGVNNDVCIIRMSYDGVLDSSFGSAGLRWLNLGGNDRGYAVAALSDGKILIGGQTDNDIAFVRLLGDAINPNGPTNIGLSAATVLESAAVGTAVGSLTATDSTLGDTFTFSLTPGTGSTDNALFSVSGDQLLVNGPLDYETKSVLSVRIRATDASGLWFEKTFSIALTDVEGPLSLTFTAGSQSATAIRARIGTVAVPEPLATKQYTFSLVSGIGDTHNSLFSINGNSVFVSSWNVQPNTPYSLRIRVTDDLGASSDAVVPVTLTANQAAKVSRAVSLGDIVAGRDGFGNSIPGLSGIDGIDPSTGLFEAAPNIGHVYEDGFKAANAASAINGVFILKANSAGTVINSSGVTFTPLADDGQGEAFDNITHNREPGNNTGMMLEGVMYAGGVGICSSAGITFDLARIGQQNGTSNRFTTTFGKMNGPGAVRGYVVFSDDTSVISSHVTRVVNDSVERAEYIDLAIPAGAKYLTLVTGAVGDITNDHGVFGAATISASQVNAQPTDIALSTNSVAEHQPLSTTVGTLTTTDSNVGDTFVYTLVSGAGSSDNASFTIVGDQLRTAASFDFETKSSYSIRVRSTDAEGLFTEKAFAVQISDGVDPPLAPVESGSNKLANGRLNASEVSSPTTFRVGLGTPGAAVGDTVELLLNGVSFNSAKTTVLASQDISTGYVDFAVSASDLGADGPKSLTAIASNVFGQSGALVFTLDTAAPTVSSVVITSATGIQNATLNAGDVVSVTVTFNEAVTVTGTPQLALNVGGTNRAANYASGSGSAGIIFTYTIQPSDSDANGISIAANSLANAGGSTITDAAGNAAVLSHSAVPDNPAFLVDNAAPTVSSVVPSGTGITSGSGMLRAGAVVTLTVNTTENVTVNTAGGTPTLSLSSGGTATYSSGSGSSALVFTYTVLAGENTPDLTVTALNGNGGTLTDAAGNSLATFTNNPAGTLAIDTGVPTVASVAITSASGILKGTLNAGDVVSVTVTFSEAVTVTGTPQLALNIGGTSRTANYASGSGSTGIVFTYTIQPSDSDANGISIAPNSLANVGGSTITDAAGNVAALTHAAVADDPAFLVDNVAPTVVSVAIMSATGILNQRLNAGDVVSVTVTFAEAVDVSGSPQLRLNVGGTTQFADYASGTGTTAIVFTYTIAAPDTDTNGISIAANSLLLNGGTITDAGGNPAVLTHAAVADNPNYLVDTTAPLAPLTPTEQGSSKLSDGYLDYVELLTATTFRAGLGASNALAGDTIELLIGGVSFTPAKSIVLTAGNITAGFVDFTVSSADLGAEGAKSLTARVIDLAGNVGAESSAVTFTKDTVSPVPRELGTTKLADGNYNITDAATGTTIRVYLANSGAAVGDTLRLLANTAPIKTVQLNVAHIFDGYADFVVTAADLGVDGAKTLSSQLTKGMTAGTNNIVINFIKDTAAPNAPSIPTEPPTPPSPTKLIDGKLNLVEYGSSTAIRISLFGTNAVTGDVASLLLNGAPFVPANAITLSAADIAAGSVDFVVQAPDLGLDGTKAISALITDAVGNAGPASVAMVFALDTVLPAAPSSPTETGTSKFADDWLNAAENATSTTVRVSIAGAVVNDTLELLVNGSPFSTAQIAPITAVEITQGFVLFTVSTADLGSDGLKALSARIIDQSGNVSNAGTPPLSFTKDTSAPSAPSTPAETGNTKLSDGLANAAELAAPIVIRVSLGSSGAVAGDTVTLLLGGVGFTPAKNAVLTSLDLSNGFIDFSVSASDLAADGQKSITARVTDAAGNEGAVSATPLPFTKDTATPAAPNAPVEMGTGKLTDGKFNANDALTNTIFRVTFGGSGAVAGDKVELLLNGVPFAPASALNPVTLAAGDITNAYVEFTLTSAYLGADGPKALSARIIDQAGNLGSPSGSLPFVKDTASPPTPFAPVEQATAKLADGNLNFADAATATWIRVGLGGTGAITGDEVELLLDGAAFATPKKVTLSPANAVDGFVDFLVTTADLGSDGNKALAARLTDVNGASIVSASLSFIKDTQAPTAPAQPSETGSTKLADGKLNLIEAASQTTIRVSLSGTGAVAGDALTLRLSPTSGAWPRATVLTGTDIANGRVDFVVSQADLGVDGFKILSADIADRFGNVSAPSLGLVFEKDTIAPAGPAAPVEAGLPRVADSYLNIVDAQTPMSVRVALGASVRANDTIELLLGGSPFATPKIVVLTPLDITTGSVTYSVSSNDLGSDGAKSIAARIIDQSGNVGIAGPALVFTKDTTAPSATGTPAERGSNKFTADGVLSVADASTSTVIRVSLGTSGAVVGDTLELLLNGAAFAPAKTRVLDALNISDSFVDFVISTADLGVDGAKSLTARVTDAAGNPGTIGATPLAFVKDVTAPAATTIPTEQGSSKLADLRLNIVEAGTATTIRVGLGTSVAITGDTIELLLGGASFATAKTVTLADADVANGFALFSVTDSDLGADGAKSLTARLTDRNSSGPESLPLNFSKDTTAPSAPTLSLAADTGSSNSDGLTNNGTVNVGGIEASATWQFVTDGSTNWQNGTGSSFQLPAGTYPAGNVKVRQIDLAGNPGATGAFASQVLIDTASPSVALASNKASLRIGETATITFTLSEPSGNFTDSDVTVTGGTLSPLVGSGTSYSATFTPFAASTAPGTVTVAANSFTDAAGNGNTAGSLSPTIAIDTAAPSVLSITSNKAALRSGETATITFLLNEPVIGLGQDDVIAVGGTISGISGSGSSFTATFTPSSEFTGVGSVAIPAGRFTDVVGNPNTAFGPIPLFAIDTTRPAVVAIASNTPAVKSGETAVFTFTLSEPVTGFTPDDLLATGGTVSGLTGSGTNYSAVFTPAIGFSGAGTITIPAGGFTDLAGNPNVAIGPVTLLSIDTVAPAIVSIASNRSALRIGETATITFTLSEPSSTFTGNDVTVTGGTLSPLAGSGNSYSATFTPFANSTSPGTIFVAIGTFTDAAGNGNTAGALSPPIAIDTVAPGIVSITSGKATLKSGETATVTFTLSEASTTFSAADVTVTGGTLSPLTGSGATYTATFTPTPNSTAPGTFAVAAGTFADAAGNANMSSALTTPISIDTVAPTIVAVMATPAGTVRAGDFVTITATVSEPVQAGSSVIVTLDTGNVVTLVAAGAGTTLTGSFNIQPGQSSNGLRAIAIGLTANGTRDLAGNPLVSTNVPEQVANTNTVTVDGVVKLVTPGGFSGNAAMIADRRVTVTAIPITFSSPVSGFNLSSVRLLLNGRSVSLRGARLTGSGANYVVTIPTRATNAKGIYTLQIFAGQIAATANGALMTEDQAIYWGKGRSIGIPQPTARAAAFAASAAPKPAAKPRAAAFRTIR